MDSSLKVSSLEFQGILRQRYPMAYIRCLDMDYNIPTEAAYQTYLSELGNDLFQKYGDKWQEFFDCENFSLEALTLACRKHWVSRYGGSGNAEGISLGLICIDSLRHCINFRLTPTKEVQEFEPQNRKPLPLTREQCLSVSLCFVF